MLHEDRNSLLDPLDSTCRKEQLSFYMTQTVLYCHTILFLHSIQVTIDICQF